MNKFWKEDSNKNKRKHYSAQHWFCHVKAKSGAGFGPAGHHVGICITDYEEFAEERASGRRAGHRHFFAKGH
eukprot:10452432-Lingulodinium_polyedra.AAC.1